MRKYPAAPLLALALSTACSPAGPRPDEGPVRPVAAPPPPAATATSAPSAAVAPEEAPSYELLAGDFHCHVMPPDSPADVARGVVETVDLAAKERLDFVILTPHVPARFFQSPRERQAVLEGQRQMREAFAPYAGGKTLFLPGMEYTDHAYGHASLAFADLEAVLAGLDVRTLRAHPERFFERWVALGGIAAINHPFSTPLDSSVPIARADLSFRPFTAGGPFPAEIQALARLAQGYEAYNFAVTDLRDRFLLSDTEHSITRTLSRMDRESVAGARRLIPVGGSDSHSHYLHASTFVLSKSRTAEGIREALLSGRVCVRSPEACSFAVRAAGQGSWVGVGGAVQGTSVEARAEGKEIEILVDGAAVAHPVSGEAARIPLPEGKCALIRARVGTGYSGAIYANCGFAGRAGS
jgi:hypothetical protein